MSIATQLTALAANRDAIKAAIEAKGVADAGDTLAEFPAAISSIPIGGTVAPRRNPCEAIYSASAGWSIQSQDETTIVLVNGSNTVSLDSVRTVIRNFSGEFETAMLLSDIPASPPEIPAKSGFENGTAFAIYVSRQLIEENMEGRGGFTFGLYGLYMANGHASYAIDWGDGSIDSGLTAHTSKNISSGAVGMGITGNGIGTNGNHNDGTAEVAHTYTTPGTYIVQISNDIEWFKVGDSITYPTITSLVSSGRDDLACRYLMSSISTVHALRWGSIVDSAYYTYRGCISLMTICEWNDAITNAGECFRYCSGLVSPIIPWNSKITNCATTFGNCSGLFGSIPEWANQIMYCNDCYTGDIGLIGTIPKWGSGITGNANAVYNECRGLVGSIPEWKAGITTANSTFAYCSSLRGKVPAWSQDIVQASTTYRECVGLTGVIPEWGASITNTTETFRDCVLLRGVWDSSASDSELMPSKITTHVNTFQNCSNILRAYFLTTWGGSRAS